MPDCPVFPGYALMSDDVELAIEVSSVCWQKSIYLPLLDMPRFFRPDWIIEVQKRIVTLQRARINKVFTIDDNATPMADILRKAGFDVGSPKLLLQTLRDETKSGNGTVTPRTLDTFLLFCGYKKRLSNSGVEYLSLDKTHEQPKAGNKLMVLESSSQVIDVSGINYAVYFRYDLKIIPEIASQFENEFERRLVAFNDGSEAFGVHREFLRSLIYAILPVEDIQEEYEGIQLIVKDIPIGILFVSIPAAHLFRVDATMKLLADVVEFRTKPVNSSLPSYLFVDLQQTDLQSEIPEVVSDISKQAQWRFHLNGKQATVPTFKLFCQFFPIDFLMVSGHGGCPYVRIAEYEYQDENGSAHVIKVREFYQFLRMVDDKVQVESKYEFLSVDGVDWEDKEEIRKRRLSIKRFVEGGREKLVSSEEISVNSLEGLVLSNGVFMGNIHFFANSGNPVLFLNTCGSLANCGKLLSFAGARAIIGTAWSIFDSDAVIFTKEFFGALRDSNLANSFFAARRAITNDYSKFSYWFIGTLNTTFKLGLDSFTILKSKEGLWQSE